MSVTTSAKGVTGVVSHYSSYPASFREFGVSDAPEHSLLVNTLFNSNEPTWTHMHARMHMNTVHLSVIQPHHIFL